MNIKVKPILFGNFIPVNSYTEGEWVDGTFVEGGLSVTGKAIVMPWNVGKDKQIMEAGGYTSNDRKCYSYDILHDPSNAEEEREVEINGEWFKLSFIKEYNESTGNFYGLKRFKKVVV